MTGHRSDDIPAAPSTSAGGPVATSPHAIPDLLSQRIRPWYERADVRRLALVGTGLASFALLASVIHPGSSRADLVGGGSAGRARDAASATDLLRSCAPSNIELDSIVLGELINADYRVIITGAEDEPRYTIFDHEGRLIARDLYADDVYRSVRDLDLQTMGVPVDTASPDAPDAVMMVDPADLR